MPSDFSLFPKLAAKQAESPALRSLFDELVVRADTLGQLQEQLLRSVVRNREARTGKQFLFTDRQKRALKEMETDAERADQQMQGNTARLNDLGLLKVALRTEHDALGLERTLYAKFREEDRILANQILEFRRETIELIRVFIEGSEFRDSEIWDYLASLEGKRTTTTKRPPETPRP
jgi:hypothetical protein